MVTIKPLLVTLQARQTKVGVIEGTGEGVWGVKTVTVTAQIQNKAKLD